jgi:hypothetical protein
MPRQPVPSFPSLSSVKLHPAAVSLVFMVAGSPSPQQISDLLATSGYWQNAQPEAFGSAQLPRRDLEPG